MAAHQEAFDPAAMGSKRSGVDVIARLGGATTFLSARTPKSNKHVVHTRKPKVYIPGIDEEKVKKFAEKRAKELFVGRVSYDDDTSSHSILKPFFMTWNVSVLATILVSSWLTLFVLGFRSWASIPESDDPATRVPALMYACDAVFIADVLADFKRPVLDRKRGIMIVKPLFIAKKYMALPNGNFWTNLIASLPLELFIPVTSFDKGGDDDDGIFGNTLSRRLRELVILVRLMRIFRIRHIIKRHASKIAAIPVHWLMLVRLICLIFATTHLLACVWSFVGDIEYLRYDQRHSGVESVVGWKLAYQDSYSSHQGGYPSSKWAWYFVCLNIGASYVVGTSPMGSVARPTTNLEQFTCCVMCLLGAGTSCYMMVEIWRIISVYSKWFDRCTEQMAEMNFMLENNEVSHSLRRRLRQHVLRSQEVVRMREGRDSAFSALSPAMQAQLVLADGETGWVRSIWWARGCSAPFLVDMAKAMVPELYSVGEKITKKKTMFVIGRFGIVARNGKVHVSGMVWGDDIIIQNERLVDTNNAIALTYSEVFCLTLLKIKTCLANNPTEISNFRKNAAKYALLRAVNKIAQEMSARRNRHLSANDYVNTLLSKFDREEDAKVDPNLLVYNQGENLYLDKAMNVLGVKSGSHDAHLRNANEGGGGGHHIDVEHFHSLEEKLKKMSGAIDRKFAALSSSSQASVNEMRHMAKIFNDVLLTHQGLVQSFRAQVGTTIARSAAKTGVGTSMAPPGFGNIAPPTSRSHVNQSSHGVDGQFFDPFPKPAKVHAFQQAGGNDVFSRNNKASPTDSVQSQPSSRVYQPDDMPPDTSDIQNNNASGGAVCFKCGQVGHFANNCPGNPSSGVNDRQTEGLSSVNTIKGMGSLFGKMPSSHSAEQDADDFLNNMLKKAEENEKKSTPLPPPPVLRSSNGGDSSRENKNSQYVEDTDNNDTSSFRLKKRMDDSLSGLDAKPGPRLSMSEQRPSTSFREGSRPGGGLGERKPSLSRLNRSRSPRGPPPSTTGVDSETKDEKRDTSRDRRRGPSVRSPPSSRSPISSRERNSNRYNEIDKEPITDAPPPSSSSSAPHDELQTSRRSSAMAAASRATTSRQSVLQSSSSSSKQAVPPSQPPMLSKDRTSGKRFSAMLMPMQSSSTSFKVKDSFKESLLTDNDNNESSTAVEMPKLQAQRNLAPRKGYESSLTSSKKNELL